MKKNVTKGQRSVYTRPQMRSLGDSRYLVGIGIYFGKSKKKETFIYNSS